ncbi:MAG: hypothetical protein ACJ74W_12820 [Pyrinomonadaceae bacterium]
MLLICQTRQVHNQVRMTRIISIEALASHQHTSAYGQYDVVIEINGIAYRLEYTCAFREENGLHIQAVTWKPEDSILADHKAVICWSSQVSRIP